MQSLIPYTNKHTPANKKEIFKPFARVLRNVNPKLTDEELAIIKQCIDKDEITAEEIEYGFIGAYKDPERYGKVEWNDIWKHIQVMRRGEHTLGDNSKLRRI